MSHFHYLHQHNRLLGWIEVGIATILLQNDLYALVGFLKKILKVFKWYAICIINYTLAQTLDFC